MENTSKYLRNEHSPLGAVAKIVVAASVAERLVKRIAPTVLRWMLGLTLLSAVVDRFGGWGAYGNPNVSWGDWAHFVAYTAKVNGSLPAGLAPTLAMLATAAEILLGLALLLGLFPRSVAWASAGLFAAFATAMSLSFGVKAPLNYSVFVDAAAALLLGAWPLRANEHPVEGSCLSAILRVCGRWRPTWRSSTSSSTKDTLQKRSTFPKTTRDFTEV